MSTQIDMGALCVLCFEFMPSCRGVGSARPENDGLRSLKKVGEIHVVLC